MRAAGAVPHANSAAARQDSTTASGQIACAAPTIGNSSSCMTTEKPSIRPIREATNTLNAVSATAIGSSRPITSATTAAVRCTPMSGASASMIVPCTVAMLARTVSAIPEAVEMFSSNCRRAPAHGTQVHLDLAHPGPTSRRFGSPILWVGPAAR
jgi:hypothetical protein